MPVPTDDELRTIEKTLESLSGEAEQTAKDVRNLVNVAAQNDSDSTNPSKADAQDVRTLGERITQALIKCDNVPVSKSAAAMALKEGNRQMARKMAILITRRKNIIRKLEESATKVEKLPKQEKS